MTPLAIGGLGLAALILLIILRMPIALAMILVGGVGVSILNGTGILFAQLKTLAYGQFSIYDLSVLPMFILMGALANRIGISADLFRAAKAWFGWVRGGTAMAAIAACAGFGAVCGSSLATASTMGKVALPELRKQNYAPFLATGTLAAGGVLGILIPPSVVLIVYSIVVEANIVTMFKAALVPGIIAIIFFMLTISLVSFIIPNAAPPGEKTSPSEWRAASLSALPTLLIFALVIGGIYAGWYNPTPAASIGVILVMVLGLWRKKLEFEALKQSLFETAKLSGMIYLILLGAELLKIFMARAEVPQALAEWMLATQFPPLVILVILLLGLILLGCLMDSLSMILLAIPFFWPVLLEMNGGLYQMADGAGFGMSSEDLKIWFGILALIVVELGLITPPIGMNVFVISSLAKDVPMRETFLGATPFFIAECLRVALLIAVPGLVLWLPKFLN